MILASKSPQRARILKELGFEFRIVPSLEKEVFNTCDSPFKIAENLAMQKAIAVAKKYPNELVLGVDTLVVNKHGKILGKPADIEKAHKMILDKSNSTEIIISGMALVCDEKSIIRHETTKVHFGKIAENDAEKILSFDEWQGRSGAFSIEGKTRLYIKGIEGDFWNVVGLPIYLLYEMIKIFKKNTCF